MAMDRFSALPFELRMHICSYYFNAHDRQFCTLKIARQETVRGRSLAALTQQVLHAASNLEEHKGSSSAKAADMIQQIQSTASALSKNIEEEYESAGAAKLIRFPPIIRHCRAIMRLGRELGEMELAFQVRPTDSCRRFLDLAHVNRRLRADLLQTCEFNLSVDMEVFAQISSSNSLEWRASIAFAYLVIGKGGLFTRGSKIQRIFAFLDSLPNLKTAYISVIFEDDRTPTGFPDRSTNDLLFLKNIERRGIRTVLCLEGCSENFMWDNVRSGKWRKTGCDTVEVEDDRERM